MSSGDDAGKGQVLVEAYRDLVRPSAAEVGKTLGGAVHTILRPANLVVWTVDQVFDFAANAVREALERRRVPAQRVVEPPIEVAGPVLNALRLPQQDPSLRGMFVNVLATAMDSESASLAHPAFAQIIQQLTPDEARIIAQFSRRHRHPLISIEARLGLGEGRLEVFTNMTLMPFSGECKYPGSGPAYVDNICRLGLAEIPAIGHLANIEAYDELLAHPSVTEAIAYVANSDGNRSEASLIVPPRVCLQQYGYKPIVEKKFLDVTEFGKQFVRACC